MTDFKNLHTSSDYAIQGFYKHVYSFIPYEFRLHYEDSEIVEAVDCQKEFYDQELTVENRLKYKATKIKYIDRSTPWIAVMWNSEGTRPADNHFRKYDVKIPTENGRFITGKACYVRRRMNLGIVSNSMTALDEFQEVFWLNVRPDDYAISVKHPIIEDFNVNIMDFDFSSTTKLPRTDGTLCMTMAVADIQYPIVGSVDTQTGIIQTISTNIINYKGVILNNFTI